MPLSNTIPNVLLWNICSITKRRAELMYLLNKYNIHIALVIETWLDGTKDFYLPGYRVVRKDRDSASRTNSQAGGGVAILIHNSIHYEVLNHDSLLYMNDSRIDSLLVRIELYNLDIAAVYVPPSVTVDTKFIKIVSSKAKKNFLIGGDWNAKHRHWLCSSSNVSGRKLYNHFIRSPYYIIHPDKHTCHPPRCNSSLIDFFVTNLNSKLEATIVDESSTIHFPVLLKDSGEEQKSPHWNTHTNWKQYSIDTRKFSLLAKINTEVEIDDKIDELTAHLKASYIKNTTCKKSDAPNLDYSQDELLKSLFSRRNRFRRIYQRTGDFYFSHNIKILSRSIKKRITLLRNEDFEKKLKSLSRTDPTFWSSYKKLTSVKENLPPIEIDNQVKLVGDLEKANAFAKAFSEVHHAAASLPSPIEERINMSVDSLSEIDIRNSYDNFYIKPVDVDNAIRSLKNKAPGPDKLTAPLLKGASIKARLQLYYLFNACIKLSYFPLAWKLARVCAVKKPGKPAKSLGSYRPISLLPILGKVFERCIFFYLKKFLADNQIIIDQQFGFRSSHSTMQQVVRITQLVTHHYNVKRHSALVLLDLSKAFDSVWHNGLIYKLLRIKMPVHFVKLMISYLANRKIFVVVNGSRSADFSVNAGVPQGSILGPMLFNIYINDIPIRENCLLALYADDTMVITASTKISVLVDRLQKYLDAILNFFYLWKLKLNSDKTEAIVITSKIKLNLNPYKISIQGHTVPWSTQVKYLGVLIDSRLSWTPAVRDRISKTQAAYQACKKLFGNNSFIKRKLQISLYKVCLRTVLTYGAHVWINAPRLELLKLRYIQNKILKTILDKNQRTPTKDILLEAKVEHISIFIRNLIDNYKVKDHENPLVTLTGTYQPENIPYRKILKKFPLTKHNFENLPNIL